MKPARRDYARIASNTITDAGVLFNLGNAPISLTLTHSVTACVFNVLVAVIALFVRLLCELKHYGISIESNQLMVRQLNTMADNKGAALMASGILTLFAAVAAFYAVFIGRASPSAYMLVFMLVCFGLVHLFRGIATGCNSLFKKSVLDGIAFVFAATGYVLANPGLPIAVLSGFVAVMLLAVYMAFRQQAFAGFKQPDLYFAATCYIAALFSDIPVIAFGFFMWGSGYISIYVMRNQQGIEQAI